MTLNPLSEPLPPSRWQRVLDFPVTRIALYLLLFAAIAAPLYFGFLGTLRLMRHRQGQDTVVLAAIAEGLTAAAELLAFWIMVRFADKRSWATAGYTRQELVPNLLGGFAIGAAMLSAGVLALRLLGAYHVLALAPSVLVLAPLGLYFSVALTEETLFRGYMFQTLEGRWGSGAALVTTSLLFGLVHLANPVPSATFWQHLAGPLQICFEAGLPMGAAYLLTRSLWLPIGIHWAWDYCEGPIYGCPDSGNRDPHTLLHATLSGPAYLTGGAFGPEAGLVFLLVGTLTGILLLAAAIKKGRWQPRPHRAA